MATEDDDAMEALSILGAFVSVFGAALAAGLTMGLMSLDSLDLLVLVESDPDDCRDPTERLELENEKKSAEVLLPLLEDHHRLLVTLLLLNSVCAEALPIFLDELVPSSVAVLLGVTFLLIFGEILPSAIFTGPSGMKAAAILAPVVRFFLVFMAPVAIPVGRFLDWWVGDEEEKIYNRSQLLALLRLHAGKSAGKLITVRQSRMMQGAMDLMHLTAGEVMTPADKVFMLSTEQELDITTLAEIVGKGYSRIPVYEKNNRNRIRGVLLTKTLAVIDPNDKIRVGNLVSRVCGCVPPEMPLNDVLAVMKATKTHICLVSDDPARMSKYMRKGRAKYDSKESVPRLLGSLSLNDIVACVVATDIGDEFSSRRPKRERMSIDSGSSSEDEGDSTPRSPSGEARVEFVSEFAKQRLMRWLERARLSARLHRQAAAQTVAVGGGGVIGEAKSETTPLVSLPASEVQGEKSSAMARRLLASWLLKRTSPKPIRAHQVAKTLQQFNAAGTDSQFPHLYDSEVSAVVTHAKKRAPMRPPESDEELA